VPLLLILREHLTKRSAIVIRIKKRLKQKFRNIYNIIYSGPDDRCSDRIPNKCSAVG